MQRVQVFLRSSSMRETVLTILEQVILLLYYPFQVSLLTILGVIMIGLVIVSVLLSMLYSSQNEITILLNKHANLGTHFL